MTLDEYPDAGRVQDVAELFQVSAWNVYERIKAGEIRALRLGRALRVSKTEVARLLYGDASPVAQGSAGPL